MEDRFPKIQALARDRQAFVQFVRFGVVGAINTVLDFGVYVALTRSFVFWSEHIVLAAVASFIVAVTSSFLLNNYWTFRMDASGLHRKGVKFIVVAVGGLIWSAVILYSLTTAGMYDIFAKVIATGIVMIWNFTLQKFWTFKA